MKRLNITLAALLLGAAPALAEDLVVFQNWSSPAEVAALEVLHKAVAAKGINWIDVTIPHDTGSSVSLLNLVAGEQPPNIFSENNSGVYRDLTQLGLGRDLKDALTESGAMAHFPPVVQQAITIDGEVRKVPLGVHIDGMVHYNLELAAKAGVDPAKWDSLDAMFADFDKIKAAGFVPLAIGAQQWQIGYLFHALTATVAGPAVYNDFYGPAPTDATIDSAELRQTLEWLRKFQSVADEASVNRDWNMTTNEVISGKALMQIHGDWMKGEWRAAGKEAGKDFGCLPIPGAKAVPVTVDGWGALGGQSAEKDAAEMLFIQTVVEAQVNADFVLAKGASPVRDDVPTENLDICAKLVKDLLQKPDYQVANPSITVDADWSNAVWTVVFNFWSDPNMSVDDAVAQLHEQRAQIFD